MPKSAKYLLIGSTEAYSGKSATILGMANQLQEKGLDLLYGKPLGTCPSESSPSGTDADVEFIAQYLHLPENRLRSPILSLDEATLTKRLAGEDHHDYQVALAQYLDISNGNLVILEGPGTLDEGSLFGLSLPQIAAVLDASVLLLARFQSVYSVDAILTAQERLGSRLIGVCLNDISAQHMETVYGTVQPFLEAKGISVLGMLPRSNLLRAVSVGELVRQLGADILCRADRLDLMVESLKIGAMNVNSALKYFRKGTNMAVVTGGDRTDIQLTALETSTQCLILTGQVTPSDLILSRAEDLEIPILSVDLDTLTTVKIIENSFGHVRLAEPVKVECMRQLMAENFQIDRLIAKLGLATAVTI